VIGNSKWLFSKTEDDEVVATLYIGYVKFGAATYHNKRAAKALSPWFASVPLHGVGVPSKKEYSATIQDAMKTVEEIVIKWVELIQKDVKDIE
jgi:hypothetical protein